jgi:hypothetical protein
MEFSQTPWNNNWSGKRDSHLASDPLKSKGFLTFPQQEWTHFWTCSERMSRTGKNIIPSRATEYSLRLIGQATISPNNVGSSLFTVPPANEQEEPEEDAVLRAHLVA